MSRTLGSGATPVSPSFRHCPFVTKSVLNQHYRYCMASLSDEGEWWGGYNEERGSTIVTGKKPNPVKDVLGDYKGRYHETRHPLFIHHVLIRVEDDTENYSIANASEPIKGHSQDL